MRPSRRRLQRVGCSRTERSNLSAGGSRHRRLRTPAPPIRRGPRPAQRSHVVSRIPPLGESTPRLQRIRPPANLRNYHVDRPGRRNRCARLVALVQTMIPPSLSIRRRSSTFSCDIAYSRRPAASRILKGPVSESRERSGTRPRRLHHRGAARKPCTRGPTWPKPRLSRGGR
jgi:hypothetical protein